MHQPPSFDLDDPIPALGTVVDESRGALPYELVHGESLVACAAWALGDARVTIVAPGTPWSSIVDSGEAFVVHDSLCPMTPAQFIGSCVERAVESETVVVGVDAEGAILSPVVIPASVAQGLDSLPSTTFDVLVRDLVARGPVERVVAPASAMRVATSADVATLELLTSPEHA